MQTACLCSPNRMDFHWQFPRTDAIDASAQQLLLLNPQGAVALRVGEAIAMGTAVGGVVVVAVSPSVILPLDTIGALPPLAVSSPSAVGKRPPLQAPLRQPVLLASLSTAA